MIVGFPGETEADVAELARFLTEARLDLVGVFGYSDEDGTDAFDFDDKLDDEEVAARVEHISTLVGELMAQRAEDRIGTTVDVLVESDDEASGRAAHQGPDVEGITRLLGPAVERGRIVPAVVVDSDGIDLVAEISGPAW